MLYVHNKNTLSATQRQDEKEEREEGSGARSSTYQSVLVPAHNPQPKAAGGDSVPPLSGPGNKTMSHSLLMDRRIGAQNT
eukprot:4398085-Karenia_brevis.AAC.1